MWPLWMSAFIAVRDQGGISAGRASERGEVCGRGLRPGSPDRRGTTWRRISDRRDSRARRCFSVVEKMSAAVRHERRGLGFCIRSDGRLQRLDVVSIQCSATYSNMASLTLDAAGNLSHRLRRRLLHACRCQDTVDVQRLGGGGTLESNGSGEPAVVFQVEENRRAMASTSSIHTRHGAPGAR